MGENTKISPQMVKDRPCQYFDGPTLGYYITTNRDGLGQDAWEEWKRRWGTEYPKKNDSATKQPKLWN